MIVFLCLLFYYLNENNILYTHTHNVYACSRYLKNIYIICLMCAFCVEKESEGFGSADFCFWVIWGNNEQIIIKWVYKNHINNKKNHEENMLSKCETFLWVCVLFFFFAEHELYNVAPSNLLNFLLLFFYIPTFYVSCLCYCIKCQFKHKN